MRINKNSIKTAILIPFFLFYFYNISLSTTQQDTIKRSLKMGDVIIKGNAAIKSIALTRTVVDSISIAQSSSGSLSELLSKSTPIFIKTYGQGSMATASFRGTGASHTSVQWNGIKINNPMLGAVDFSLIPVWFIDNIELYHGGSSLQNGSGALGGSLSINSKPRWGEKYYGTIVQGIGSFGKYQTYISAGGGNKKIQGGVKYMYERAQNDFTFINTAIPPFEKSIQKNAQYDKHAIASDLYINAGADNFIAINSWFHISKRNLPTIMSYEGLGRAEYENSNDIRLSAKWTKYWKKVRSEFTTGYSRSDMDYLLSNKTYLQWVINKDSKSTTNSIFNKYIVDWDISSKSILKFSANLDYHDVSTIEKTTKEGYQADRLEAGMSVSFHHIFNSVFSGYALLREDISGGKFSPIMPSLGISINPLKNDKFIIAINGTRNFHQPTLNDLYWQPGGNPNLRPEKGFSGDISLKYNKSFGRFHTTISTTGYLSKIDDWIIWRPSEFMYWSAENIQKVFSRGIEATFDIGYTANNLKLNLIGNYTFTKTTDQSDDDIITESKGKQLIYIPMHKASVLFNTQYKGYYFDFSWDFTSERYTTSSNEDTRHTLPYYSLCDLSIGKKLYFGARDKTALDIQFKINNIFDINYQSILWRAMPGINFQLQLKFSF